MDADAKRPHIKVIEPEQAEGRLKEIYDGLLQSRGKIAEVHKIQSLNPESIISHMEFYMTVMFGRSPLKRVQREMIGVVVSRANECNYCQVHHAEAVNSFWKDGLRTHKLRENWRDAGLDTADAALASYAETLTLYPGKATKTDLTAILREAGFADRAILDATLVVGYFNFVNRIVQGLAVPLEENPGGYKYD